MSQPASKESIQRLIENTGRTVKDLYGKVVEQIAIRDKLDETVHPLQCTVYDVLIGANFSYMDALVSVRAAFLSDKAYHKRFHWKNAMACLSESFKLIKGFGDSGKKSLLPRLVKQLDSQPATVKDTFKKLLEDFKQFGNSEIDQDLRNLTLHYDDAMIKVYDKTMTINSEDELLHRMFKFIDLLQNTKEQCNKLIHGDSVIATIKATLTTQPEPFLFDLHEKIAPLLAENGQLGEAIEKGTENAVSFMDVLAYNTDQKEKAKKFMLDNFGAVPDGEAALDEIATLLNAEFIVQFARADIASLTKAYLESSCGIEYALNMRRTLVTKTSTMVHLYGYSDEEKQRSVWKDIVKLIPASELSLTIEAARLQGQFDMVVSGNDDKDKRALYVHYKDKKKNSIPFLIESMQNMIAPAELTEMARLIKLTTELGNFINKLMEYLAQKSHNANVETTRKLNETIDDMKNRLLGSNTDSDLKAKLLEVLNKMEQMINADLN